MAVIVPVGDMAASDAAIRARVWARVTELLKPGLGKCFAAFQPASMAWKQALSDPLGVVIGKTEPALFLYFYGAAKVMQEKAITYHLEQVMGELEPESKILNGEIIGYVIEVKNDGKNLGPHMLWHMGMITGEPLPDCGVYFLEEREAFVTDNLDKRVREYLPSYALCLVELQEVSHAGN